MRDVSRVPLAIVGMSCRLPGADGLEGYWSLLSEGRVGTGELPADRFDREKHYDPRKGVRTRSYTSLGGVVQPRPFDLSRFPLPQWLIERTAGCHLNMCEIAARAFEHAGWDPYNAPHRNAGVFIGHAPPMSQFSRMVYARMVGHTAEYLREIPDFDAMVRGQASEVIRDVVESVRAGIEDDDPKVRMRVHANYLPALLARQFQLDGPAVAFDAACASSLRALAHGARALQLGEIDMAIVGSASYCHADTLVLFSQAQSVSPTGSRPFDDGADGLVAAEGYVILLIKTLEKALADGDPVQAVIRGIGVASDGKGKSLWAPRKEGQMEAIFRAYSDDVRPADLQYIEMHATSTQVGDSTEMSALAEALIPMLPEGMRLPVGSAKANVGHTLETAGLASLVKTVLAMQHRMIPPQINVKNPSSKIDWANIPFYPSSEAIAWNEPGNGKLRRAAVNAFGIGGLNVHVVLEDYQPVEAKRLVDEWKAKTPAATTAASDEEAIAVIGMGAVLPGVRNIDRLWDKLASGKPAFAEVPAKRWNGRIGLTPGKTGPWSIPTNVGGFLTEFEFDWKKHKIPPKQVQTCAPLQLMLLDAAEQALQSAGYDIKPLDPLRTGVIVGAIFGTEFGDKLQMGMRVTDFQATLRDVLEHRGIPAETIATILSKYEDRLLHHMPALVDETGSFTASTLASRITKMFDLMGGACAVDAGDASGAAALAASIQLLRTGESDMMLCASGDNPLTFAHYESLTRHGLLSTTGQHAPFSSESTGYVPSEGACVLVLKRLPDAQRDGNRIHAIIRGIGTAWDVSPADGLRRAARRALEQSGLTEADVATVESSANGITEIDRADLEAVRDVYATADRASPVLVTSASAQFGHLGGGSAMAAVVKAVAELNHAELPPLGGSIAPGAEFTQPAENCRLAVTPSKLEASNEEGRLIAGINALSASGAAYHVIIERPTKVAPPAKKAKAAQPKQSALIAAPITSTWALYRVGAASPAQLRDAVAALIAGKGAASARFEASHALRLAVVARGQDEFLARCKSALPYLEGAISPIDLAKAGVYCGEVSTARMKPGLRSDDALLASLAAAGTLGDEALKHYLSAVACLDVVGALDTEVPTSVEAPAAGAIADLAWLNAVRVDGNAFAMGKSQGEAHANAIRLVLRRYADLAGSRWDRGAAFDQAILAPEQWFDADELEEMRGIAKGAGVTLQAIVAHHVRLFLDGGAGGQHFAVSAAANPQEGLIHGYNEDIRQALSVRDCLERSIQVRFPESGNAHVTFGVVGTLGGLSGLNAAGLSVSAACLLDPAADPRPGKLLPCFVRSILQNADSLEAAIELARATTVSVPYSLVLTHGPSGRAAVIECHGTSFQAAAEIGSFAGTNHRTGHDDSAPVHSRLRQQRLARLLGGETFRGLTAEQAQFALRDQFDPSRNRDSVWPTMNTVRRADNQISVVLQPAAGKIWITPGPRANGHQNQYVEIDAATLFGAAPGLARPESNAGVARPEPSKGVAGTMHDASKFVVTAADVLKSYDSAAANAKPGQVCERYVLRVVESVPVQSTNVAAPGNALIVGDNPVAQALKKQLEKQGTHVALIPTAQQSDDVLKQIDAAFAEGEFPHLFLATPHDADAATSLDATVWGHRRERGVMLPYRACQRWFQHVVEAGLLGSASVAGLTTLGGDFGISGHFRGVEGGALTGLLKGVAAEVALGKGIATGFRTKLIDSAPDVPAEDLARFVVNELAGDVDGTEIEVGFAPGKRLLMRPVVERISGAVGRSGHALPVGQGRATPSRPELPRGAPFVVTGGARGVTAVVARELGLRYGLKLHLVGSSPRPEIAESYHTMSPAELKEVKGTVMKEALASGEKPADAWSRFEKALEIDRSLRELRAAGVQATYHGCDVSNRAALAGVLEEVRRVDGPIVGVIHGAGFERATRFEKKQIELVDRTFAAKVDGAAALMELTQNDPLRYFAAFGSVSGRFGGVGQTDYSSANDLLAKLVDWFRTQRPECGAAVFHWHAWDDVGMAVRPESQHIRKLHNIQFMPSKEGADHLIDELVAGLPEGEIAITELQYCRDKFGKLPVIEPAPGAASEGSAVPGKAAAVRRPLIDRVVELEPGKRLTAEIVLDPVNDLFLARHLYRGRPMMPVVVTMEAMAEAAQIVAGPSKQVVSLSDIEIVNGLRFAGDQPQVARVRVTAQGDRMTCEFTSDVVNRKGIVLKADQPYLRCVLNVSDRPASFSQRRQKPPRTWYDIWYHDTDTVIYHGDEFRCIKRGGEENGQSFGEFLAPAHGNLAGRRGGEGWIMPSALLDAGFYGSGVMLWVKYQGLVAIPAGIGGITLGRPARAGETCIAQFHDRGRDGNTALYDFTLFGDDGKVICHVDGYRNIIVAEQPADAAKG